MDLKKGADPKEYIHLIEERNRLLKKLEERKKSKEVVQNMQREQGFTTYISGANEERVRDARKREYTRPGKK
jgi:hypothetical protein